MSTRWTCPNILSTRYGCPYKAKKEPPPKTFKRLYFNKMQNTNHFTENTTKLNMWTPKCTLPPKQGLRNIYEHCTLAQLSPEWMAASESCTVTASKAAVLLHCHPYLTLTNYTLLKVLQKPLPSPSAYAKTMFLDPGINNEARIKRIVPAVILAYCCYGKLEEQTEDEFTCPSVVLQETGLFICDENYDYKNIKVGASPDGLLVNKETNEIISVVEIKTPRTLYRGIQKMIALMKADPKDDAEAELSFKMQSEIIPMYQYIQVQLQMYACKVDTCVYVCSPMDTPDIIHLLRIKKCPGTISYIMHCISDWAASLYTFDTAALQSKSIKRREQEIKRLYYTKEDIKNDALRASQFSSITYVGNIDICVSTLDLKLRT